MKKGDILFGRKGSDAIHPIVFLKGKDDNFFIGAMLTKADSFKDNLPMMKSYFKTKNDEGNLYEFKFNNTHLVKAKLIKRAEWKPFRKIGELSEKGIVFVNEKIGSLVEMLWEEYLMK